jgi:hypothetical protein
MPRHSRGQAFAGASPFGWASFGAWRRSEQLLHRLGASWRRLGLVQMITGTDRSAPRSPTELFQLLGVLAGQSVIPRSSSSWRTDLWNGSVPISNSRAASAMVRRSGGPIPR